MIVDATDEPADFTVEAKLLALRMMDRKLGKNRLLLLPLLGDKAVYAVSLIIPGNPSESIQLSLNFILFYWVELD